MDKLEKVDLLDVLLDDNNREPIYMTNADGKIIAFEQVAVIPHEDELYCILKPITEIKGVADDEAIVFRVSENEAGDSMLCIEENESVAVKVFMAYYDLLEESF